MAARMIATGRHRSIAALLFVFALALFPAGAAAALPQPVSEALKKAGVPEPNVAVFVQRVDAEQPGVSHLAEQSFNPASTMKLLTTYAGLELLGPAYRWKTEVYRQGELVGGVLHGDLILKGSGDPSLMQQDFWLLLNRLRQAGVSEIRGNLVLDASYFAPRLDDPGAFDNEPYRAYNAMPSALLLNLKASSFHFQPSREAGMDVLRINAEPAIRQLTVINQLKLVAGACPDWRSNLRYDISKLHQGMSVTFSGTYAASCGEHYLELSLFDDASYVSGLFNKLWLQLGGTLRGGLVQAVTPPTAVKLLTHESPPLADILRGINKYSNNLMARQLLLTIAAVRSGRPATEADGIEAIHAWLNAKSMLFPELVIENGAGLSRIERISAANMGRLLLAAYASPVMPEFMSSLPILSQDGTVQRRLRHSDVQGRAHLKTGSLDDVRAFAGYMLDRHGKRWVLVFMANGPRAAHTKHAQDALLEWVYQQPGCCKAQ